MVFEERTRNPLFLLISAIFFLLLTAVSGFCGRVALTIIFPNNPCISTCQELQNMQNDPSANYCLAKDIDCSATNPGNPANAGSPWDNGGFGFKPIGDSFTPFTGNFDGRDHKITGLHINRPSDNYIGLFGFTGSGSRVENVDLEDARVTGKNYVGGLVGQSDGSITNCYSICVSNCTTHGNSNIVDAPSLGFGNAYGGGLVGYAKGSIENSHFIGRVHVEGGIMSASGTGGLVGYTSDKVTNCHSEGKVEGFWTAGGLVGRAVGAEISDSYSTSMLANGISYYGGLIGYSNNSTVENCYADGGVYNNGNYSGGLIGYSNNSTIRECYSDAFTRGWSKIGGLIGSSRNDTIENCYFVNTVWGLTLGGQDPEVAGGLIAYSDNSTIENCYSIGQIAGSFAATDAGGLIGKFDSGTITDCYWDINRSGQTDTCGQGTCPVPADPNYGGRIIAHMRLEATYQPAWDFVGDTDPDDIWKIEIDDPHTPWPFLEDTCPCLNWQTAPCPR